MFFGLWMLLSSADAFEVGLSTGLESEVIDPFVRRWGPRVGVEFAPTRHVSFSLSGTFYPDFGSGDWSALTTTLIQEAKVSPDISKVISHERVGVRVFPLHARTGIFDTYLGALVGLGFVYTQDDLEALQAEGDPDAMATERQWHLTTTWGFSADIRSPWVGLRWRFEGSDYVETLMGTTLANKSLFFLGVDFMVFLHGDKRN